MNKKKNKKLKVEETNKTVFSSLLKGIFVFAAIYGLGGGFKK